MCTGGVVTMYSSSVLGVQLLCILACTGGVVTMFSICVLGE